MADTQYELFRDLDRHCVAGGVQDAECLEAVRRKRACIESELNRKNPLVREVLEGRTTFSATYDDFSRAFRGFRRFLPMRHDDAHNERLEHFAAIVPNTRHFVRRSVLATDNPVTCAAYGIVAAAGVVLVWSHAIGTDGDGRSLESETVAAVVLGLAFLGFIAGLFAMVKYRTRVQGSIHAREAALYMDLNYNCHRTFDDEAWARFVALKTTPSPHPGFPAATEPGPVTPPSPKSAAAT